MVGAEERLNTDSPLVIELFGHPGAGKSTLVQAANKHSERHTNAALGSAWKRQSRLGKGRLVGRALLDAPCLRNALEFAIHGRIFRGDSLPRLARLLVKGQWIRSQQEPLLLEEGHLQDLWSVLYSAGRRNPDPRRVAPLLRCLYRRVDARIVFLELDPESAFQRIRSRKHGKSRLDRLADDELREKLTERAQLPHCLIDAARLAGLPVVSLDASLPIASNVQRLRALMGTGE